MLEAILKACNGIWSILMSTFSFVSDVLGIQWAPARLPLERRLQTLAALGWILLILVGEAAAIALFLKVVYSDYWWAAVLYGVWMLNDINVCNEGGRTVEFIRNLSWWRYYRDYFPLKLVKTADLDPSRNYLFACFPHGVICSGAFGAFATNALGFHNLFPGMSVNMITLGGHFLVPLYREFILGLGGCSSSPESLLYLLDKKRHKGKCVALIVGGAAEALDSHPGEYSVLLSRRKGFVRIAMKSGAPLVPVFSFGEPDVFRPFHNPAHSRLRRLQELVRQYTGVSPMFPVGRGLLQYSYGVLPLRTPVTTVVGEPMEVERNLDPTDEQVDAVHAAFTARLVQLFQTQKGKYLQEHERARLVIT